MKKIELFILVLTLALSIFSCDKKEQNAQQDELLDARPFTELQTTLEKQNIQRVLIYEKSELLWSYTQKGWNPENLHVVHSCTKSIVSILIGTLIDQGRIESVDVPVMDFFPNLNPDKLPVESRTLTLEHFLTMTTGLRSRDSYLYNWKGLNEIWYKADWISVILSLKSEAPGGERFDYSNLASFLLAEVVRSVTGKDAALYAEEILFAPLGIENYIWKKNLRGQSTGWGGLQLLPEDLAKIGILVLNRGEWEGRRIVSSTWLDEATTPRVSPDTLREHYGYHWWIDSEERVMAIGYQGQYLIIDRKLELVTVFSSQLADHYFFQPYEMYKKYIINE